MTLAMLSLLRAKKHDIPDQAALDAPRHADVAKKA
jgi:hypothetical protein